MQIVKQDGISRKIPRSLYGVPPSTCVIVNITVESNLHRAVWCSVICDHIDIIYVFGAVSRLDHNAHLEAELQALLESLNRLRPLAEGVCCRVFISASVYSLLFGSKKLRSLDAIVRLIREAHISLRADVIIEPQRVLNSESRLNAASHLRLAPKPQALPTSQEGGAWAA